MAENLESGELVKRNNKDNNEAAFQFATSGVLIHKPGTRGHRVDDHATGNQYFTCSRIQGHIYSKEDVFSSVSKVMKARQNSGRSLT